ncbi:MFS family permease [Conyzicola lurida]|uniref:MFS family permease n=1 Tax=Conyzicola lurida TaxID=1172621 RepID=A0A841ARG0_9MICO|nr:MFS transporter [Conyzicola lurida]MBB5844888.1 MFS family permease [Conyzicola lurida]
MRTLSRRSSFWVAASVAAIALWTSAAPTVTYPLYAAEWDLATATTTAIFAVYPITLVVALAVFGNLSDYVGRRVAILTGLAASLLGVILFAVAPSVEWLFAGRALMGLGVALSLSPATAAVVEFSAPGQAKRAGSVTTAATAVGLVLSMLVGGALIEYAPLPTHLNFVVLSAFIAVVGVFAWFLPRHSPDVAAGRWRPRGIVVPRGIRHFFAIGALSLVSAFALGVIFLSLGADIAQTLIGSDNALVNGSLLAVNAAMIAVAAILLRNVAPVTLVMLGAVTTVVGIGVLLASSLQHSLALFLVAAVITGFGYSMLFSGGLGTVSAAAPAHHRAGTLSAVYLVAYFFQGATALFLGSLATGYDLQFALEIGAVVVTVFSVTALVLGLTLGRGTATATEPAPAA